MKKSSLLTKLAALVFGGLSLAACGRAEYAMLPQGPSYYGTSATTRSVAAPVATRPTAALTPQAPTVAPATAPTAVATASTVTPTLAPTALASAMATAAVAPTMAPKMTRVQRFAATRLVRTVSTIAGISQFKKQLDTARTQKLSGNLRTGVILLLIGLLVSLFAGINGIFGLIGAVIAVIGLIFIILWLLDNL